MSAAVRAGAYLHHLQLMSPDPAALAAFYGRAMDMTVAQLPDGQFLCQGPLRCMLFTKGTARQLGFGAFATRDPDGLNEIRMRARDAGVELLPSPSKLFGEEAFGVRDPDGNLILFGLGKREPPPAGLRGPLQHLTLATHDVDAIEAFYADKLGFLVSDRVRKPDGSVATCFMRSNHEHHTLACFRADIRGVDHHSYEAGEWAVMKDWCDRMGEHAIPIMWGPGRHGPGNNLFIFIEDPDRNWIEISAELEVMYDRPVREWPHAERTLNLWGRAIMRS
jgi:catechol 2,3-dioxygenase-like lactoylglutathione lyase family enzyme